MNRKKILAIMLTLAMAMTSLPLVSYGDEVSEGDASDKISFDKDAEFVKDEIIVIYKDGATASDIQDFESEADTDAKKIETDSIGDMDYSVVEIKDKEDLEKKMAEFAQDPNVESVQPNYIYRLQEDESSKEQNIDASRLTGRAGTAANSANTQNLPTDPGAVDKQWHLYDAQVSTANNLCKNLAKSKVKIGVVDTGCDVNHPDLQACINKSKSKNMVTSKPTKLTRDHDDYNGHGTHVSGVIAATANNGKGGAGVASGILGNNKVDLIATNVFKWVYGNFGAEASDIVKALNYLRKQNVNVINCSFGCEGYYPFEKNAYDACQKAGITVVAAAGNNGQYSRMDPMYPAAHSSTISVAAIRIAEIYDNGTYSIEPADFSYHGSTVNIAAPGEDIYSTIPRSLGSYPYMSGTSQASPVVAGCAAVYYSLYPEITPSQVKSSLCRNAYDMYTDGRDDYTGWGDVDAGKSTQDAKRYRAVYRGLKPSAKLTGYRSVKFSWKKVSGVSKYKIYYKKSTWSNYKLLKTAYSGSSIKKKNLAKGSKYYFKIKAYKTINGRQYIVQHKETVYTLKKPEIKSASKASSGKVRVKWKNIKGESGYQISRSSKKSGIHIVKTYRTTTGKSVKVPAKRYKKYYYRVRAYKIVGGKKIYGPWSNYRSYTRK